jgi:hypothetical protein
MEKSARIAQGLTPTGIAGTDVCLSASSCAIGTP